MPMPWNCPLPDLNSTSIWPKMFSCIQIVVTVYDPESQDNNSWSLKVEIRNKGFRNWDCMFQILDS